MTATYEAFLAGKRQSDGNHGFDCDEPGAFLYPFQRDLVRWALLKGRAAIFADCGLGKTPMQLAWADMVSRHTGKPVLIATPLAVSYQVVREGEKFDIECHRAIDGVVPLGARIVVTNYERVHHFNPSDFAGMVCDESSILKNFDGVRKAEVTEFLRTLPYRLLCTATAAPNDYVELGTSAEALGEMGYMDMLGRFFRNVQGHSNPRVGWRGQAHADGAKWRFKGHAETPFWRWICSWARACRKPSDLGYSDERFALPPLHEFKHIVEARTLRKGWLFDTPAMGFHEEREERRRTIQERCEKVAELATHSDQVLVWCHLNDEGNLLEQLIPDAVQVQGSDSDNDKEDRLCDFAQGNIRALVTKPKIGAWGLNLQRCAHVTFFPSHSYEQFYQGVRRCWRFGQERPVRVDIVGTEGSRRTMDNLQRKADQADHMFDALIREMNHEMTISRADNHTQEVQAPQWQ